MRSFWRLLLVWLTALAVPVQGIAAAAMLHCANGSAASLTQAVEHVHADGHSHPHAKARGTAEPGAPPAAGVDDGAGGVAAEAPGAGHQCSACAACCVGVALPPFVAALPAPERSCAPAAVSAAAPISFIVGGPERPPRVDLA